MATVGPSVRADVEAAPAAGPAHVAVVSFLASRVVPSGGFWLALAGGVALARVSERRGARQGYGASVAAMMETVAIIGPLRFGVPLTQAVTAPLLGRYEARGMAAWGQIVICMMLRLAQNALQTAFFIFVLAGGLDAVTGTYDRIAGIVGLEVDHTGTIVLTGIGLVGWAIFASIVQVLVYRRGLTRWDELDAGLEPDVVHGAGAAGELDAGPEPGAAPDRRPGAAPTSAPSPDDPPGTARFDPRLLALAAAVLFALLLATTAWPVLAAVAALLAVAWALSRPDRGPLRAGLAFTLALAGGVLVVALIGGLGIDVALRRAARAALLVLTATWLRAAARAEGLRFAFHRALHRLRRLPAVPEAAAVLDSLTSERRLAASARAFADSIDGVPKRPVPFVDAVIGWVVRESSLRPARQADHSYGDAR